MVLCDHFSESATVATVRRKHGDLVPQHTMNAPQRVDVLESKRIKDAAAAKLLGKFLSSPHASTFSPMAESMSETFRTFVDFHNLFITRDCT